MKATSSTRGYINPRAINEAKGITYKGVVLGNYQAGIFVKDIVMVEYDTLEVTPCFFRVQSVAAK